MADKIKIRRGNFINLPDLDSGEFGLSVDTGTLYIGTPDRNVLLNPVLENGDGYSIDGYFIPATDNVHFLGTPDSRWHSLHVGPGTINVSARSTDAGYSADVEFSIGVDGSTGTLQITSGDTQIMILEPSGGVTFPGGGFLEMDPSIMLTIDEHYIQHSDALGSIVKALEFDGYTLSPDIGATGDGYLAFYTGVGRSIAGSDALYWNREFKFLGVGKTNPTVALDVEGAIVLTGSLTPAVTNTSTLGSSGFGWSTVHFNTAARSNTLGSAATPAYSFNADTNTGMYSAGSDNLNFATNSTVRLSITTTQVTPALSVIPSANNTFTLGASGTGWSTIHAATAFRSNTLGSAGIPAYSFDGDSNTGMYSAGSDNLNFSTGSTVKLGISTTTISPSLSVIPTSGNAFNLGSSGLPWASIFFATAVQSAVSGSAAAPVYSFTASSTTGLYSPSSNQIAITTGGTLRLTVSTTQIIPALSVVPSADNTLTMGASGLGWSTVHASTAFRSNTLGSATTPAYSFNADTNTGMYSAGADNLNFTTAGSVKLGITTAQINPGLSIIPTTDDAIDLGTSTIRFRDIYLGPTSLHILSTAGETGTARDYELNIQETVGADRGYLRLFEGATQLLAIKPVDGYVGIGTTAPVNKLEVAGGLLVGSGLAAVEAPQDGLRVQGNVVFDKMQHYSSAYRTVDSTAINGSFSAFGSTNGGTVITYVTQGISFDTTTGVATITENGLYSIEAFLLVTQSTSAAMDDFSILLNGADTIWLSQPYVTSTASPVSIHAGFYYALTSGETLQVMVDGNGANTIVVENGSTFNVRRIS